jgi:hypothetical protein
MGKYLVLDWEQKEDNLSTKVSQEIKNHLEFFQRTIYYCTVLLFFDIK